MRHTKPPGVSLLGTGNGAYIRTFLGDHSQEHDIKATQPLADFRFQKTRDIRLLLAQHLKRAQGDFYTHQQGQLPSARLSTWWSDYKQTDFALPKSPLGAV